LEKIILVSSREQDAPTTKIILSFLFFLSCALSAVFSEYILTKAKYLELTHNPKSKI